MGDGYGFGCYIWYPDYFRNFPINVYNPSVDLAFDSVNYLIMTEVGKFLK